MKLRRSRRAVGIGAGAAHALLALSVVGGCRTTSDVEEIKATQEQILERLAALERNDQALLASLRSGALPDGSDPNQVYGIAAGASPAKGPKDAPVTIVEFLDYQCPFSRSSTELIDEVFASYPQKIRLVVKQFPLAQLHRDAQAAAKAALAAHRQGKFWEMHDLLFEKQHALDYERLRKYARVLGLDVERFEADMASADLDGELRADIAVGRNAKVSGTPTFFVQGKRVGTRSFEGFKSMIEAALDGKPATS
jgi:protein-disulfide isomerase